MSEPSQAVRQAVAKVGWRPLLEKVRPPDRFGYVGPLATRAHEAFESGDEEAGIGWRTLARLFSGRIDRIPASPKARGKDAEQDCGQFPWFLSAEELSVAEELVEAWDDPEFVASLGDLIWVRLRKADHAKRAARAYVASAERLFDPEHWPGPMDRYRRALDLALAVDPKGETPKEVVAAIQAALERLGGADPYYFTMRLASLLTEHRLGDPRRMAELLEARGRHGGWTNEEQHSRDSEYFEVAARLYSSLQDEESERRCLIESAEAMARHAERFHDQGPGSRGAAPHWMKAAIKLARRIKGGEERVRELHNRLHELERESMGDMISFRQPIEIPDELTETLAAMAREDFPMAVCKLAMELPPVEMEPLRRSVEREAESPFFGIMPPAFLREDGKLDERVEGVPFGGPIPEPTMRKLMHSHARLVWQVRAALIAVTLRSLQDAHG